MGKKRPKPRHLQVSVVLDTNALYTGSASYFLRKEVGELIAHQVDTADLTVRWIVPDIVRHERQFQLNHTLRDATIALPRGGEEYSVEKWTINAPSFVRKQGQRVYWSSRVQARLKVTKSAPVSAWKPSVFVSHPDTTRNWRHRVVLHCEDVAGAFSFYRNRLGFEVTFPPRLIDKLRTLRKAEHHDKHFGARR